MDGLSRRRKKKKGSGEQSKKKKNPLEVVKSWNKDEPNESIYDSLKKGATSVKRKSFEQYKDERKPRVKSERRAPSRGAEIPWDYSTDAPTVRQAQPSNWNWKKVYEHRH